MSEARRNERLSPRRAALLVIDLQERLAAAMPPAVLERVVRNTSILIDAAARMKLPIVVSQQYPKGLGATLPPLEAALQAAAGATAVHRFDKVEFSAAALPEFAQLPPLQRADGQLERDQWIVAGMEAHVCVYQTVRDLLGSVSPRAVHVASDGVCSRTKANWRIGLELCDRLGAIITSTEVCVFDLLERAGGDDFKALSRAIK